MQVRGGKRRVGETIDVTRDLAAPQEQDRRRRVVRPHGVAPITAQGQQMGTGSPLMMIAREEKGFLRLFQAEGWAPFSLVVVLVEVAPFGVEPGSLEEQAVVGSNLFFHPERRGDLFRVVVGAPAPGAVIECFERITE